MKKPCVFYSLYIASYVAIASLEENKFISHLNWIVILLVATISNDSLHRLL